MCPFAMAQYGIFDQTADWGPRGSFKVEGSVEVVGTGANAIYNMAGNGDDIWNNDDEGFFVYTEKSGSWRLSAKVYWENPGGNDWAKIGVMMRETGNSATSRHYWIELRGAGFGDRTDAQWRMTTGGGSGNTQIFQADGSTNVSDPGDGLFLRITRYAEIDLVVSEYSFDGSNWIFAHSQTMAFQDTIAWGLAITNHDDNQVLAEAAVSNVKLEQVESVVAVTRGFDVSSFLPGQTINVTLNVSNPGAAKTVTLTETPPAAFTVSNISNGGTLSGGKITWSYNAPSGPSTLNYQVDVPANYNPSTTGYTARWSGTDGTLDFVGKTNLFLINVAVGDELFSFDFENAAQADQWTDLAGFWDVENGRFYEFLDAGGPLVTATGGFDLADVAITVQGMGLVGDADWGIAFRITDLNNHYSWQFVNSLLALIMYSGGARTELFTMAYPEELNVWQEFKVIAKGNVFYLYFNGEVMAVVENSTHAAGQVGFFGWVNAGTTISVEQVGGIAFDNFVVFAVTTPTDVSQWSIY
ncbi:MAG: DUF11 domain-containing protein [Candidatus Omnitrophota bacterium]|nr:MAG: DUF11 domain-containing protein [Candidatus Omnitrophota bacterium]